MPFRSLSHPKFIARGLYVTALVLQLGLPSLLGAQEAALTTVRAVRSLTLEQAGAAHPVVLHGVVTTLSGWKNSFFLQDSTGGISVNRTDQLPELKQGQSVEVRGVTEPALFAPSITASSVRVKGLAPLPRERVYSLGELTGGVQDSQWIAMRGVVRSADIEMIWGEPTMVLSIDVENGNLITARVLHFDPGAVHRLVASTVIVRGACGTVFNDRRQFVGNRLFVASLADIKIVRPAPVEPFAAPSRPLNSLLRFGNGDLAATMVKISGSVTWSRPGEGLYLQTGPDGVFVQSGVAAEVPLGSRVEAVGYPAPGSYSPKLENAVFRSVGAGPPVEPLVVSAASMIVGEATFRAAPYDGALVRVRGQLLEQIPGSNEDLLLLRDGKTFFTARMARSAFRKLNPRVGSVLSLTGVCVASADRAHEANSFTILLRSPSDIVVLQRPPWWTAAHATWVVSLLALALCLLQAWMAFLRHHAALRTMAVSDPLTELHNRRGFHLLAQQQWQLAQRAGTPMLLFYIDLDRFKQINDNFGHKEGDAALRSVAGLLTGTFRKTDVIARLGGDEFVVAAIDASSPPWVSEARLVKAVQELNGTRRHAFEISLSIGVLQCDASMAGKTIEELLAVADELMYKQKQQRRSGADPPRATIPTTLSLQS